MHKIENISQFHSYSESLSAGGQPTLEQLKSLKEAGFEVIINISPVSARNALHNEHQLTENLKLDYIHFPVDCSALKPFHYLTFRNILKSTEGQKTFIHCGANIKSSNLIHMYLVLEKGIDEAESLSILKKIQNPEDKWLSYFKRMGMPGVTKQDFITGVSGSK